MTSKKSTPSSPFPQYPLVPELPMAPVACASSSLKYGRHKLRMSDQNQRLRSVFLLRNANKSHSANKIAQFHSVMLSSDKPSIAYSAHLDSSNLASKLAPCRSHPIFFHSVGMSGMNPVLHFMVIAVILDSVWVVDYSLALFVFRAMSN